MSSFVIWQNTSDQRHKLLGSLQTQLTPVDSESEIHCKNSEKEGNSCKALGDVT